MVCVPKSSVVGVRLTCGAGIGTPVPLSVMTAVPLLASEAIDKVAVRIPRAPGAKVRMTLQSPAIGSGVPTAHVPVRVKSPGFVPPKVKALKLSARLPPLWTVIVCAEVLASWVSA